MVAICGFGIKYGMTSVDHLTDYSFLNWFSFYIECGKDQNSVQECGFMRECSRKPSHQTAKVMNQDGGHSMIFVFFFFPLNIYVYLFNIATRACIL